MNAPLQTKPDLLIPGLFICPEYDRNCGHDLTRLDPAITFHMLVYRRKDYVTGFNRDELGRRVWDFLVAECLELQLSYGELIAPGSEPTQLHRPEIPLAHQTFRLFLRNPNAVISSELAVLRAERAARKRNALRARYSRPPVELAESRFAHLEMAEHHPEPEDIPFLLDNSDALVVSSYGAGEFGQFCWVVQRGRRLVQDVAFYCPSIGVDCVLRPAGSTLPAW